jgi:hypothetical protein
VKYYHHPGQSFAIGQCETIISFLQAFRGQSGHHRWHILQAQNRVSSFNTDHMMSKIHPKYGVQALSLLVNQEIDFFLQVHLEGTISWLHLEAQTGSQRLNTIHLISQLHPKYSIVYRYTRHAVKNQIHRLIDRDVRGLLYCM